ncbi:hypothetical protein P8452_21696 [Trifolium repens]|nr:hypothetical protein P8452_21696 [Trifolium repens]
MFMGNEVTVKGKRALFLSSRILRLLLHKS